MRGHGASSLLVIVAALSTCSAPVWAGGPNSTQLLSRPSGLGPLPAPGEGGAGAGSKAISGNASRIVFDSEADDLGVRDTFRHIWLRESDTTTLVDRVPGSGEPGNGFAFEAAISRDGSTVCFTGDATNLAPGVTGRHVYVVTLSSGTIAVADRASGPDGAVGNGSVERCALNADGTRVVFESEADNLVTGDTNGSSDVFVRDLDANTTTRVSVDEMGAEAAGGEDGAINADGTRIAFASFAALVSGDTNGFEDVYVRDTQNGTLVRVSVGTGSVQADGDSFDPAIDDSGGIVAFTSSATNLDLGPDTNGKLDVFWRSLGADTTILVSRASTAGGALGDDDSREPAISGDSTGVAFQSAATNLGGGPPAGEQHVYLRQLGTNETLLLSRASGATGDPADGFATDVSLPTAPGVAVFRAVGSNLVPDATGHFPEVFLRELPATTTLVSRPSGTEPRSTGVSDSNTGSRGISADGRVVAMLSESNAFDVAATVPFAQIFVRDALTDTTTLVSRAPGPAGAAADGHCLAFAINALGTHVAFHSEATNLLGGTVSGLVYVRDLATGTLDVASRAAGVPGAIAIALQETPDISADGRRVAFTTTESLVPADQNGRDDVYVRDLVAGTTILASVGVGGILGDGSARNPALSDDGVRVAFQSQASNLLGGDPITGTHVYIRDLVTGTTVLADRRSADGTPGSGQASRPEISGDGTRVAFRATEALTAEAVPPSGATYVRDLETDTTILASRGDGPDGAAVGAFSYALSQDGIRMSFGASAAGLPGPQETSQVYVRDLAAGTTVLASAADGTPDTPANADSLRNALSADGGCVAFDSHADNLTVPAYPTRDFAQVYLRAVTGECPLGGTSSTTSTTLPPTSAQAIAAKTVVLRPDKLLKLVAKGVSALSPVAADPTVGDSVLAVSGTTGSVFFALPQSGWKAVGRRRPKGFKFKGDACRLSFVRQRLKAVCRGDTGELALPEAGPLEIVLTLGAQRAAYCAECGGTPAGKPARVFKRKRCAAPTSCP
jgi:Tol biopolymer transport system component